MTDFTNCPIVPGRAYNGANGSKIAVEYGGGIYMLKFPPSGERKPTNLSYTNSCISEHLASSIFAAFFSPWWINLEPSPDCHFSRCQSMPPDVKSWTTIFTNFYFRSASTSRRKSLIFLDIPPFFSLAVYFFALIFIFTADDPGSSPFSIIKESSFNLFLCCAISLQDSISIFSKNPAFLWFFHQKQKFDPTCHQQPEKIGVKNAMRFLLKKTKIFNFRASDTLFPLHHVLR